MTPVFVLREATNFLGKNVPDTGRLWTYTYVSLYHPMPGLNQKFINDKCS